MVGNSLFEKTMYIAQRSLGADTLRKKVIANNIANVDTPHYKRHTVTFESEMNRALQEERKTRFLLNTTHERHIPGFKVKHFSETAPRVHVEFNTNYRNDKNNVDIEKEISDEVKNSLHYSAMTTAVGNNYRKLRSVMA